MSQLTSISLPQSVPFPVTITSILCRKGQTVSKHDTIVKYKYWDFQDDPLSKEEEPPKIRVERIGSFESPVEGVVEDVFVHVNEEVYHSEMVLFLIQEECTHTVQYGGLCALCGRAVGDEKDYTGYDYQERATISMSYDNTGLKISLDEAKRIEENTTSRLAKEKKLILVVDLDQTVIHATVDPTVREWQLDPLNPNHRAVKDVQSFCLEEEIVQRGSMHPSKCWYYVKVRPGLAEFLADVSQKYELHIYTMATRNYALAIAKIIDPDGKFFGDRILSRDESGSLTHKNLKRLFPVDQLMVVIIDDRGDVWQWESNLIKVVPYDFFVGIGDINSSFLPKKNGQLTGPSKHRKSLARLEHHDEERSEAIPEENNETSKEPQDRDSGELSPVDRMVEMGGGEGNTSLLQEQAITRSASIEQQQHERPLAKLQQDLTKLHSANHSESEASAAEEEDEDDDENLLHDDDTELFSLNKVLLNIHSEYYNFKDSQVKPDLTRIIPHMKSKVLGGITVLFSGIIPLGINFESADIVIWCRQFGVKVVKDVVPSVTHVICRDPLLGFGPTFKARVAKKVLPNVKIVNPDWLFACLSKWEKVDEKPYFVSYHDEQDWRVNEEDVSKYQKTLEKQSTQRVNDTPLDESDDGANIEYEYDEANQEVDDFLAGISDDDDDNGDSNDENDENDDSVADELTTRSFIQDAYKNARKRTWNGDEDENGSKKLKANGSQENMDELEQELLDVFDDLEEV